jgi:hypothetical protein
VELTQIIGFLAGFGTTFAALPDRHAQTAVQRGHEPEDGSHHGKRRWCGCSAGP